MPTPLIIPKFDMDQETGTIAHWIKAEGDPVKLDEPVLVIETDKVSIEVPSPAAGTLAGISAEVGVVLPVTTVIGYILAEGETLADLPAVEPDAAAKTSEAQAPSIPEKGVSPPPTSPAVTPVAARMAAELAVDLTQVPAAGPRVTRKDIERFVATEYDGSGRVKVPATPAARRVAHERGVDLTQVPGSGPRGRVQEGDVLSKTAPGPQAVVPTPGRVSDVVPLAGIRATIAGRMQTSFQTAPHIALTVDVDVTHLEATRTRMNALAERRAEARVSLTALLVKTVAWALARHPYLNASLLEDGIHLWGDINIGVATALPEGLIVPVIHGADRKPVGEINRALRDLADRARQGQLALPEVQGGTFTVSNLGMFGIKQFRAIINPPESAILAVGRVVRQPVVVDDQDQIAVRPMMNLTLSADHRVVDGVVAANFLSELVEALETPDLLLY